MIPDQTALIHALHATQPNPDTRQIGPITLRFASTGPYGQAASATACPREDDLSRAEQTMQHEGQSPTWQVPHDATDLDAILAARGYRRSKGKLVLRAAVASVAAQDLPYLSVFDAWPPMAIQSEIWAAGGCGAQRQDAFIQAPEPKSSFLARAEDTPAGAGFAAIHNGIAMIYALEVLPALRRQGAARNMIITIARWAQQQGADHLGLAVAADNAPALALYQTMGFAQAGGYHYRILDGAAPNGGSPE